MLKLFSGYKDFVDFHFWFIRTGAWTWNVFDLSESAMVLEDVNMLDIFEDASIDHDFDFDVLKQDWEDYKDRPEFIIGFPKSTIQSMYKLDDGDLYINLLLGSAMVRSYKEGKDPDSICKKVSKCVGWLESTDFFTSPASTVYHDAYTGGLLQHSLTVVDKAIALMEAQPFKSRCSYENAVFVGLVHDWCKIGMYESYMRNVKDETTGTWTKVPSYKIKEDRYSCLGHGVSSMYLASKMFKLSVEEACAIRWHMGEYNVAHNEMNELHQANVTYPLVQLIQFADRLSITDY